MATSEESPHPFAMLSGTTQPPAEESTPSQPPQPPYDEDDDETQAEEHPFGAPGPPLSRHSAFYRGFWTGLGALTAIALALAVREAKSVIVLVLVAVFLAVGLNPVVEWFERRGFRRQLAVLVVTIIALGLVALFVTALVPVIR